MKILDNTKEPGDLVVRKAMERVFPEAARRAQDFLCGDCLDRRCQNDSICKAFIATTESFAWEIRSNGYEYN